MPDRKIATCCYCGSRTVLTLRGTVRHQLACSACGAPLSAMKALRRDAEPAAARAARRPKTATPGPPQEMPSRQARSMRKRRKPFVRRALDRFEDVIEDLFDFFD